jgi:hypothetical protein
MFEWRGLIHKPTCDNPNASAQKAFRDFRLTPRRITPIRPESLARIAASVEQIRARRAELKSAKLAASRAARVAASPTEPAALSYDDLREIRGIVAKFSDVLRSDAETELLYDLFTDSYRASVSHPNGDSAAHKALRKFLRELSARRRRR